MEKMPHVYSSTQSTCVPLRSLFFKPSIPPTLYFLRNQEHQPAPEGHCVGNTIGVVCGCSTCVGMLYYVNVSSPLLTFIGIGSCCTGYFAGPALFALLELGLRSIITTCRRQQSGYQNSLTEEINAITLNDIVESYQRLKKALIHLKEQIMDNRQELPPLSKEDSEISLSTNDNSNIWSMSLKEFAQKLIQKEFTMNSCQYINDNNLNVSFHAPHNFIRQAHFNQAQIDNLSLEAIDRLEIKLQKILSYIEKLQNKFLHNHEDERQPLQMNYNYSDYSSN